MSGPRPSRKRPSAVHRRAGHARPLRHCCNKKRLFALCIVGGVLTPPRRLPEIRFPGMAPGAVKTAPYKAMANRRFPVLKTKNARPPLPRGRAGCANVAYSAWIAPVGQTPSQAPQSTQVAASTTALSSMVIAPTGQVSTHAPQATHSLETV